MKYKDEITTIPSGHFDGFTPLESFGYNCSESLHLDNDKARYFGHLKFPSKAGDLRG